MGVKSVICKNDVIGNVGSYSEGEELQNRLASLIFTRAKYYLRREGTSFVWDKILFSSSLATDDSRAGFGVRVIRVSWNFLLVRTLSLRFSTEPCKEYENPIFIQDTTVSILN